jgi:hypothetical protein
MRRDDRCMVVDDERFKVAVVSYVIIVGGTGRLLPLNNSNLLGLGYAIHLEIFKI